MKSSFSSRILMALFSMGLFGLIGGIGAFVGLLYYFGRGLPDYHTLAGYEPPIVTRAYASDGRLLAEFATQKRVFVPISTVPPLVIHAFLSSEDKNFYTHPGIDIVGIVRAAAINFSHLGQRRRRMGASTITQQVAKNFFLSSEATYERKIKEAILSFRIEETYTKDQILQLYLNEIFLGAGVYGIAAASLEYFNKPLDELTLEEAAYLAALPKAPNNYNPERNYNAALTRRNWVINQMVSNGYVETAKAEVAKEKPLVLARRDRSQYVNHPYFAEEVRRKLMDLYGEKGLYEGGLIAHTTLDPAYQRIAEKALQNGLINYDTRFGLHSSAIAYVDIKGEWQTALGKISLPAGAEDFVPAVILKSSHKKAVIGLSDGKKGVIPYDKMKWAYGKKNVSPLKAGDVWLVENANKKGKEGSLPTYWLRQIPKVQGGIIAMDPHTGRISAMAGGFSYKMSEFNRATQAVRQPGSSFKPFVYLTALENGFTPATLVLDAPFALDQGANLGTWRPKNYSDDFLGLTPLRVGIEKSRNLMTIRLASYIGIDKIAITAKRFGIIDDMPPLLSMAVGAGETTLLRMITGYSSFVNGGKKVSPTMIDRVQDRNGKTVYVHDQRYCRDCGSRIAWNGQSTPEIADDREQIADPRHMYQIVSILEGAVQRGTGVRMKSIGRPVAGKTGTTNESKDTWFISFTPNVIVGVYVGFDNPKPMGAKETGSRVALPIVKEFMEQTLKDVSPVPFRVPEGIRLVKINALTGTRVRQEDEKTLLEAFLIGTEPGDEPTMFTGQGVNPVSGLIHAGESEDTGLGGLY